VWHQFAAPYIVECACQTELPGMIGIKAARALAKKQPKSFAIKVASSRKPVPEIRPSATHENAITELLGNLSARTLMEYPPKIVLLDEEIVRTEASFFECQYQGLDPIS
jgi:hypothetical protein